MDHKPVFFKQRIALHMLNALMVITGCMHGKRNQQNN